MTKKMLLLFLPEPSDNNKNSTLTFSVYYLICLVFYPGRFTNQSAIRPFSIFMAYRFRIFAAPHHHVLFSLRRCILPALSSVSITHLQLLRNGFCLFHCVFPAKFFLIHLPAIFCPQNLYPLASEKLFLHIPGFKGSCSA